MAAIHSLHDDLEDRLRVEFMDDARDRLEVMYQALNAVSRGERTGADVMGVVRIECHNLKGMGTSFGFPVVSLIAHRLEDYLGGLRELNEQRHISDVQIFLDRVSEMVDRPNQPAVAETNQIIRSLPVRYQFDIADVEVRNVEVMLVTPSKVVARKVEGELAACGFRVVRVVDPIESISLAVRVPPDFVMASMVMDGLSGLDLIRGLRAMSLTKDVPMALLTSLDLNHPSLKEIPAGVAVIRAGEHFGEDFAEAVARFNIG